MIITYSELEGAVSVDSDSKDPLLTDVNSKFIGCMEQLQKSTKVREYAIICTYVCMYVRMYMYMLNKNSL